MAAPVVPQGPGKVGVVYQGISQDIVEPAKRGLLAKGLNIRLHEMQRGIGTDAAHARP